MVREMMRNTYKSILAIMAGAMVLGACCKEAVVEEPKADEVLPVKGNIDFTASIANDDDSTRASIDTSNSIVWNKGDEISVISYGDNNRCTLASGAGSTNGSFLGYCETGTDVYAIYPYSENNNLTAYDPNKCSDFIIDWNGIDQTAVTGSFPLNTPMVAYTENVEEGATTIPLSFKNVCALVKFTTDYVCKSVVFKAKGDNEYLAADKIIVENVSSNNPHIYQTSGDRSNTVTLTGKDGANIPAGTYYIAVMPGTLANGFELTFTNIYEEMQLKKETSKSVTLKRNTILNLGEISIKGKMVGMAGLGTLADPYTIHDFDQLGEMRDFVNRSSAGAHSSYKLVADIDGGGKDFTPIGTKSIPFAGNFDGNGKTIKNIKLEEYYSTVINFGITSGYDGLILQRTHISALFAIVRDAVLKNVTIDNMTLSDCSKDIYTQGTYAKSPFVGVCIGNEDSKTTISGVTVTANQSCGLKETRNGLNIYYAYGGIVAASSGNLSIENCTNHSGFNDNYDYTHKSDDYNEGFFGGMLGFACGGVGDTESSGLDFGAQVKINKCRNFGNFEFSVHPLAHMNIGGILGSAWNYVSDDDVCARIVNCVNFGTLLTTGDQNGETASSMHNDSIERAGGIVGYMNSDGYDGADPSIENCANNGAISTYRPAGGIVGVCDNDSNIVIKYCASYGAISKKGYSSIIGNDADDVTVGYYKDNWDGASVQDCIGNMNMSIEAYSLPYCKWRVYSEDNDKLDLVF